LRVLVPTPQAAYRYGVPFQSLEKVAMAGLRVAQGPERFLRLARVAGPEQAARLLPALRLLLRAGAEPEHLEAGPLRKALEGYLESLRQEGLCDSAEVFHRARSRPRPIQVLGYPYLGAGELSFLARLAAPGSEVWLPFGDDPLFRLNEEAAAFLEAQGFQVVREPGPWDWRKWVQAQPSASVHPDPEAEVRHTLKQVRARLEAGVPPRRIAISAREEQVYLPLLLAVAREYGLSLSLFQRLSLERTLVGRAFDLLLAAWASGWQGAPLRLLKRHPLAPEVEAFQALPAEAPGLAYAQTLWDWVETLPTPNPRERAAKEAIRKLLGLYQREVREGPALAEELRSLLRQEAVPYWPGKGVEFHSPLALFGAAVDHLFVLGAAEGLWPQPVADDPVLPFHLRRRLREAHGLPLEGPVEAAQRERLSALALLLTAQKTLHLSLPLRLGREPLAPSPLLEELGLEAQPPAHLPPASPIEARWAQLSLQDPVAQKARKALWVEFHRLYDRIPSHEGEVGAIPRGPIPLEALPDLRRCPFRFWLRGVLRPHRAPDPRAEALRRLLREVHLHPNPKEAALERLPQLPLARGHREALRARLESEAILPQESQLLLVDAPFTATWKGIPLEGRLDHVERRSEALWVLVYVGREGPDPALNVFRNILPEVVGEQAQVEFVHLYGEPREDQASEVNPGSFFQTAFPPDWSQKACWSCGFKALCRHGAHFARKEKV
jgi:hypothetical protein